MSKSTISAIGLIVLGTLAVLSFPLAVLLAQYAGLGFATLTTLFLVTAMTRVARSLIPIRAYSWFKVERDAERPGITRVVIMLELTAAVVAMGLLSITSSWWQPLLGTDLPLWLLGLQALRTAATAAMVAQGSLRRPLVSMIAFVDIIVVMPLVALISGSLVATIVIPTIVTWVLLLLLVGTPASTLPTSKKLVSSAPDDRWMLGSWLRGLVGSMRDPALVLVAGAGLLVPYTASGLLASVMAMPFLALVMTPTWPTSRVVRVALGIVSSTLAFVTVRELGPIVYQTIFPDAFGDGSLMRVLAYACFAIIAVSARPQSENAGQKRLVLAAVIDAVLLVGLTVAFGVTGFLLAVAGTTIVTATIGLQSKTSDPLIAL